MKQPIHVAEVWWSDKIRALKHAMSRDLGQVTTSIADEMMQMANWKWETSMSWNDVSTQAIKKCDNWTSRRHVLADIEKSRDDVKPISQEHRRKRINTFENDLKKLMAEVQQRKGTRKDQGEAKEREKNGKW